MTTVVVVDYGLGNLFSVARALEALDAQVLVTGDPAAVRAADRLVLPGVGAFGDGMRQLRERGLVEPLQAHVEAGRPFLGICLGMQMLFDEGEEFGRHEGLGLLPGAVVAIPSLTAAGVPQKIPHIGWSALIPAKNEGEDGGANRSAALLEAPVHDDGEGPFMYFVHSYEAVAADGCRIADAMYGGRRIAALVGRDLLCGCQFHPEKSGPAGLRLLDSFLRL